eukprot:1267525-Rhodomonas_salina.1
MSGSPHRQPQPALLPRRSAHLQSAEMAFENEPRVKCVMAKVRVFAGTYCASEPVQPGPYAIDGSIDGFVQPCHEVLFVVMHFLLPGFMLMTPRSAMMNIVVASRMMRLGSRHFLCVCNSLRKARQRGKPSSRKKTLYPFLRLSLVELLSVIHLRDATYPGITQWTHVSSTHNTQEGDGGFVGSEVSNVSSNASSPQRP